jgi:hypothetical protein
MRDVTVQARANDLALAKVRVQFIALLPAVMLPT